ncbi:MAG: CocE/NonD family hydrolase [Pseudomonadota bacterium]|nr:CocE/NonD family hydrolase [Pseudomonadota bacterium]
MRDGVKLHAEVWRPKNATGKLPILMQRSPYGFGLTRVTRSFDLEYKELAQEGFIFVLEDIRGRFGSGGDFVMLRPKATTRGSVDESSDTYDSIDWIVKSLPDNNGSVGVFGVSYMGWTAAMATRDPHPALKAVSVQASPEDMFLGDDFHHNGAFRLQYGWEYVAALETDGRTLNAFSYGKDDPYSWLLKQDDLATLDERGLGRTLPSWQNFVEHPNYDAFWRAEVTSGLMPAKVQIPNLIVAGWWDQEDFYGPLMIYKRQQKGDLNQLNFLVIGPWDHGGWMREQGDHYGPVDLGSDTSAYFRAQAETPWFKYWLKHEGTLQEPQALVFETGSNQWRRYNSWPPHTGVTRKSLNLHAGGKLSFEPPQRATDSEPDRFMSDPANPVPYRQLPIATIVAEETSWSRWLADDQAPFAKRADVLSWQTELLQSDVTIRGDVVAKLYASTTGSDADWVIKLIDIFPTDDATPPDLRGRQLIIADEVFRGRFRASFEHPHAIEPGRVLRYSIDLHTASHVFKKDHRIAVQVQSTWFPLIDRNPQTFQPSIFKAKHADYRKQSHSVFHTTQYPSAIIVDVAANDAPESGLTKH